MIGAVFTTQFHLILLRAAMLQRARYHTHMSLSKKLTGFVYHDDCQTHIAGPGHPESPDRVVAIKQAVDRVALGQEIAHLVPHEATRDSLEAAHDAKYIDSVESAEHSGGRQLDPDTRAGTGSNRAARLAAGGIVQAVDQVMEGQWKNAFVAARPPGHHAEHDRAMGFCLYNHVAIAAQHLRRKHGLERVAILDWDVHHGNGTQHIFEKDPNVFYASLHQFPHYPGTGAANERGVGDGVGATLNCPMQAGSGDVEWLSVFEARVLPALSKFNPEFVIVSAGFDAHREDPLAGCNLSTAGFQSLTRGALDLASDCAEGRLVSLLEGGYDLNALADSALVHLSELHDR
ncbi:MAG: acetoin utilization deacetylase AcuC-like enzyme [Planctomycetota bacterium]|jgi:acetoin utilization deacetylase AcuC-like enzyme